MPTKGRPCSSAIWKNNILERAWEKKWLVHILAVMKKIGLGLETNYNSNDATPCQTFWREYLDRVKNGGKFRIFLVTICFFLYHSSNLLRCLSNRRKLRILMNYYSNEAKPCRTWCTLFCSIYVFEVGGNRRSMQSFLSYFSLLYNFFFLYNFAIYFNEENWSIRLKKFYYVSFEALTKLYFYNSFGYNFLKSFICTSRMLQNYT